MPKVPQTVLLSSLTKNQVEALQSFTQQGSLQVSLRNEKEPVLPTHLVLVLDCSGSMTGRPMELLNRAIDATWQMLRPGDLMSIVAFGTSANVIVQEKTKDELAKGIPALGSMGGTNYTAALQKTLDMLGDADLTKRLSGEAVHTVAKVILFMSDGKPNSSGNWRALVPEFSHLAYTLIPMGIGGSVDEDKLLEIAEESGGIYNHASSEAELEQYLKGTLSFSQNLVYASPKLEMTVFPGVQVSNVRCVTPPWKLLDDAGPGTHVLNLPDIEPDDVVEVVFEVHASEPGRDGEKQDLIEWNLAGAPTEITSVHWVDTKTCLLAPANTRPAVLTKIFQGLDAVRKNDGKTARQIADSLTKISNDQLAISGATLVKTATQSGGTRGKLLEFISKTKTSRDGKVK